MELPKEMLFTAEELLVIDQEEQEIKAQLLLKRAAREAEADKRQRERFDQPN